jgi:hypothetical protein
MFVSVGLFIQRDGVNIAIYHSIAPNCDRVLSVNECKSYSVWLTDYNRHLKVLAQPSIVSHDPVTYLAEWLYWMWYRLFFVVNGPNSSFVNYPPLPLPALTAAAVGLAASWAVFKWRKKLLHDNPYLIFITLISILYVVALFYEGYQYYKYTGVLELMNGRYLFPVLLLVGALSAQAINLSLRKRETTKVLITFAVLVLFLQGGGFLTFISRSGTNWYWPDQTVVAVNKVARRVVSHVVVKGKKPVSRNSDSDIFWFIP